MRASLQTRKDSLVPLCELISQETQIQQKAPDPDHELQNRPASVLTVRGAPHVHLLGAAFLFAGCSPPCPRFTIHFPSYQDRNLG